MESLSEHEAMRVLQAAAALDAARATSSRHVTSTRGSSKQPAAPAPASQAAAPDALPQTPSQGLGDDIWREMAETDGGEQKRHGDLDSWLDVFRGTATSVRNAWRHMECLTFESLAFGWLALARKHEALPVVPGSAAGEELADTSCVAQWLSEAAWAQAAYTAGTAEQLIAMLGLQPEDLIAHQPESTGVRPAFFIAVHHDSRAVRLVIRGTGHLRDLLTNLAGHSAPLGQGFAHHGMLAAARQLLAEEAGRLRGALEAAPGYGLHVVGHSMGAGTAALVALLAVTEPATAEALGRPASVRATAFAPPPCVTADLADATTGYVDSVVYNADLVCRCSVLSLRRLANELSGASEEVLARSELAQALRRSGALGLANHLVAAALCRCQPPQEAGAAANGAPAAAGTAAGPVAGGVLPLPPRAAVADGLSALGGALSKAAAAAIAPPAQPNGRAAQLAALGSQLKAAAGAAVNAAAAEIQSAAAASRSTSSSSIPLPPHAPVGPPNGTLPPLVTSGSPGGGTAMRTIPDPALRRGTDAPAVLSPPPLVAAAAAAASAQTAAAAVAVGPTPPRKGLTGFLGDLKTVVQQDGRGTVLAAATAAAAAAAAAVLSPSYGDPSSGSWPRVEAGVAAGAVVLEPLPAPPTLPPGSVVTGVPVVVPSLLPGPRRDVVLGGGGLASLEGPSGTTTPSGPQALSRPSSPRRGRLADGQNEATAPVGSPKSVAAPAAADAVEQQPDGDVVADGTAQSYEYHEQLVPGRVFVIERRGADATATFRLLRDVGRTQLGRMLLKRSMLRDHLLSHYVAALERVTHQ